MSPQFWARRALALPSPLFLALSLAGLTLSTICPHAEGAVSDADQSAARTALLNGVSNIAVVGAPGRIAIFDPPGAVAGQGAFGVMHDGDYQPMVAAAFWGNGRVLGFGHGGYVNFGAHGDTQDTGTLYLNAVPWTSQLGGTGIGIVTPDAATSAWLTAQGYTNVAVHADWENHLAGAALLIVKLNANVSAAQQSALSQFVPAGGGLITGGTGWGQKQLGADLKTMSGNVLLRDAGLGWADGFRIGTTDATSLSTPLSNASAALDFTAQVWNGTVTPADAQITEAGRAIETVLSTLPDSHALAQAISQQFAARAATLSATPNTPVSDKLDQAVLTWEANQLASTPVTSVVAHHTAAAVYGAIPAGADRSARPVEVDTSKARWLSTGMYAVPGETVTLTLPASLVGYDIQIGGHTDNIASRSSWNRLPFGTSRRFSIDSTSMEIASAFGGAIYIDVGTPPPGLGSLSLTISGAVQAPFFELRKVTNAEWIGGIRDHPAPYAEFVSDHVAMSLPSAWIRSLDDPEALMTYWDEACRFQDWIGGVEALRTYPERFNVDVQISAGYLHAGYPIQGPTSASASTDLVDLPTLQAEGQWGYFHELGHEQQRRPDRAWGYTNHYTFQGDVEVTVNIFANAALERLVQKPPITGWGWSAHPDEVMRRAITTVNNAAAPDFESKDPYPFYFQLADAFGWDVYRQVLSSYHDDFANNPGNLPSTNQEKKDQWLQRWSQITQQNLVHYMVTQWGLECSQSASDAVNAMGLPDWLPLASSIPCASLRTNSTLNLDLGSAGLSLDGSATLISVSQPGQGSLVDMGGGQYAFTPPTDYVGPTSFTATYRSSAGNDVSLITALTVTDGLVASWPLNEGQGTSLADMGPAQATGTAQGDPQWVDGYSGQALAFDGIDDHITVGTAASLGGQTDFTVSAWILTIGSGVIIQQRNGGFNGEYMFSVNADGTLNFFIYGNSAFQYSITTSQTVNDGQWHHVAAQREGTAGRIYIDGQLAASAIGTVRDLDASISVGIGADIRDHNKYFSGTIDDVRIHEFAIGITPFSVWMSPYFPSTAAPNIVGLTADPNSDGWPNALAFVLGAPPNAYAPESFPTQVRTSEFYTLEFPRQDAALYLNPRCRYSADLQTWTTALDGQDGVMITVHDDAFGVGTDRVRIQIPHHGASRLFCELVADTP